MDTEQEVPDDSVWRRSCGIWGMLIMLLGTALGFAAQAQTTAAIEHAWSYCVGLPWVPAYEEAPDSSRFDLIGWML